jgi:hypothetical protein
MRGIRPTTDKLQQQLIRALRMAAAAGALVFWAVPATARDQARPFSTLPPPSPPAELLRSRLLPSCLGDDVRVNDLPDQALAEVIIDVNPLNPDNLVMCGYARSIN